MPSFCTLSADMVLASRLTPALGAFQAWHAAAALDQKVLQPMQRKESVSRRSRMLTWILKGRYTLYMKDPNPPEPREGPGRGCWVVINGSSPHEKGRVWVLLYEPIVDWLHT